MTVDHVAAFLADGPGDQFARNECALGDTTTITIDVTADDIANGQTGTADQCPVALALRRQIPGLVAVGVGVDWIDWTDLRDDTYYAHTPTAARIFISRYDLDEPVEPETFVLHPAPVYQRVVWATP